ncbi:MULTISPECIES: malate synthase A [Pseudarthrobacter]|uniref:Malate synthase n=1 Tax=Pseudarthrobacter oxydans TaxID=1671 RepID=A0AAW8NCL1_PSEOX|nr:MULTISPECIES: malate synthase A [Pseudarthrobacter]MDV2981036.1 malate synthase A [Actinomycetes bacterium ARC8]WHP60061.1 malate synthase A [Arthrobacter sp. KFRI-F3372]MDR6792677.1 malate synthase [Pseudarthrobacter oxydans]MDR7164065.1 malate synthase [Pseudarthrobacter oxydans]NSX37844.1 malate synthase A [Pseudarthrobacter oxydans]
MNSFTDSFTINGITMTAQPICRQDEVLTPDALAFIAKLHRTTAARRQELLQARRTRRAEIAAGQDPRFLRETEEIRNDPSWRVAPPAPGLEDRRVEITGPVDKKMTINALNSGAKVWLADMEDSSTPTWRNVIKGQLNLTDALERRIDFTSPEGKEYKLRPAGDLPTIVVRPRGWHLPEKHMLIDGEPIAGGIVDFGLFFFHNARRLLAQGKGPYFYLPKIENHLEARLWNDIFILAQDLLGIPQGTIRATVLIETITAAFEMEEILYELRDHAAGLNAGRWDYIFSLIKNFRTRGPRFVLPDRSQVTMTQPFMRAYTEQLVRACHKRGAMAIGGMAAAVPNRKDEAANTNALEKVRADKTREANDGFDGSWVAHPDLVPVCREVFDSILGSKPNQLDRTREDVVPDDRALINVAATTGTITEQGIRNNIEVGIRYIESWLRGNGAVAIHNLMEDAATAEISRSQLWQWMFASAITDRGEIVTHHWIEELLDEEFARLERFDGDRFEDARDIFEEVTMARDFPSFLTLPAYARYLTEAREKATVEELAAA